MESNFRTGASGCEKRVWREEREWDADALAAGKKVSDKRRARNASSRVEIASATHVYSLATRRENSPQSLATAKAPGHPWTPFRPYSFILALLSTSFLSRPFFIHNKVGTGLGLHLALSSTRALEDCLSMMRKELFFTRLSPSLPLPLSLIFSFLSSR